MIIYLYGQDSYRRQEKLKWYIQEFKKKHSNLAMEKFDLSEASAKADLERLQEFIKSQSLFSGVKLGVVCNLRETEPKAVTPILKSVMDQKDITLIVSEDKKLTKEFDFLLKAHTVHEFESFTAQKLIVFIQMETKKRGISLDSESQDLLAQVYNGNTWGLITELDKLALLDEKKITKNVLDKHLDISLPLNIFSVLGQMQSGRSIGARLSALEELFSRSQDPGMIFNISSAMAGADTTKMADYDVAIKSGKLEYDEALLDLALGN